MATADPVLGLAVSVLSGGVDGNNETITNEGAAWNDPNYIQYSDLQTH